jgi:hypothetical protein
MFFSSRSRELEESSREHFQDAVFVLSIFLIVLNILAHIRSLDVLIWLI